MKPVLVILFALVAVGAGALIQALLSSSATPVETAAAPAADAGVSQRLERVEARLEQVVEALAALRAQGAGPRTAAPAPATPTLKGAPDATPSAPPRPRAAAPPPANLSGKTDEQLDLEATALLNDRKDVAGALRRWRALLDRNPSEEHRLAALMGMGLALRKQGELDTAAETFQRLTKEAPRGSRREYDAHLWLGSTEFERGSYKLSLAEAEYVIDSRDATEWQVAGARWMRATALIKLGDEGGARRELESMLDDYAGKDGMEPLLRQYRNQLQQLD